MTENIVVGTIVVVLLFVCIGLYIYHDNQIQKATYDDI